MVVYSVGQALYMQIWCDLGVRHQYSRIDIFYHQSVVRRSSFGSFGNIVCRELGLEQEWWGFLAFQIGATQPRYTGIPIKKHFVRISEKLTMQSLFLSILFSSIQIFKWFLNYNFSFWCWHWYILLSACIASFRMEYFSFLHLAIWWLVSGGLELFLCMDSNHSFISSWISLWLNTFAQFSELPCTLKHTLNDIS